MGKLRNHQNPHHLQIQKHTKAKRKRIKVTYISNPIMVKACSASEFRAIVQELTGKNSDSTWSSPHATITQESSRVLDHETPHAKTGHENVDDGFFYPISSLKFKDEGFFWSDEFFENLSGFQSPCVFRMKKHHRGRCRSELACDLDRCR
ncbi:hypothetical protein L1049_020568 [Liquidambar formosana]|uniref:VQ domain-containing protein n=1 Tax=Liquidambar formosana TaxID=63359 RepID=A0AAP0SE58_LIQFO